MCIYTGRFFAFMTCRKTIKEMLYLLNTANVDCYGRAIIRKGFLLRADRLHSPCGLTTWTAALTDGSAFIRRSCS